MSTRRWIAGACVTGVLLAAGALAAISADGPAPRPPPAVVHVGDRRDGRVVPASFLGLSIEWDSIRPYTGPPAHRREDLLRLLAPLRAAARSPLGLRLGGDTADQAWWNPGGRRPRPRTVLQDIGPDTLGDVAWLARGLGGPVTLGLNLALGDPANARALLRAARAALPPGSLAAAELGNEPDLYTHGHTFRRGGHLHRRLAKDPHYDVQRYARDVGRYLDVLHRPGAPRLVVAGFAGRSWWQHLPALLRRWHDRAGAVGAHLYALPDCAAPTPSEFWLTSPSASADRVATLRPLAALARRRRLPLLLGELNSAACGGRPGWSDTPAAAVWLADTLFSALRLGAAHVDVHTWHGARYAPFATTHDGVRPRPPMAGMLAFAHGAPVGSRLVPTTVSGAGSLRAWATRDRRRTTRVALLSPDGDRAAVPAGGRAGCARLWRGAGAGSSCRCPVHGRYVVGLPAASVAVLTLPPRGGGRACPAGGAAPAAAA